MRGSRLQAVDPTSPLKSENELPRRTSPKAKERRRQGERKQAKDKEGARRKRNRTRQEKRNKEEKTRLGCEKVGEVGGASVPAPPCTTCGRCPPATSDTCASSGWGRSLTHVVVWLVHIKTYWRLFSVHLLQSGGTGFGGACLGLSGISNFRSGSPPSALSDRGRRAPSQLLAFGASRRSARPAASLGSFKDCSCIPPALPASSSASRTSWGGSCAEGLGASRP